jgi:hypothetical protein
MRQGGSEIAWQRFSQPVLALPPFDLTKTDTSEGRRKALPSARPGWLRGAASHPDIARSRFFAHQIGLSVRFDLLSSVVQPVWHQARPAGAPATEIAAALTGDSAAHDHEHSGPHLVHRQTGTHARGCNTVAQVRSLAQVVKAQVRGQFWLLIGWRPQQDSNLRTRLRRPLLYPLSYGGSDTARRALTASRSQGTSTVGM